MMSLNHIIRDSDIGYKYLYKLYIVPNLRKLYNAYYHQRIQTHTKNLSLPIANTSVQQDNENEDVLEIDETLQSNSSILPKDINLGQEQDDVHLARIIIHFKMYTFVEYISRFIILLIVFIDILCDELS
eukprot:263232_1